MHARINTYARTHVRAHANKHTRPNTLFTEALKEAALEVETLRETSSTLQREKGDKVREAIGTP